MRTVFAIVVLFSVFLFGGTKEANAVSQLPGATLESVGITLSQDGTVSVTPRLGSAGCKHGILQLYSPKIRWPDGRTTDQTLFEDYGEQSGETRTIGPYSAGTRLVFEIRPQTFVCGRYFYLSSDWEHARITRNSRDNWTISLEDYTDEDFNDLYLDVVVNPQRIRWFEGVFFEEIIAKRLPFSPSPHYKLPWEGGESHQVWQVPNAGYHQGANAYDFGGSFTVVAPEKGVVLWVEDGFGPGRCDANDENLRARTNVIVLQTSPDTQVTFVHLKQGSAKVKRGETVDQGQELAVSGDSGFICGEHLHFEFQQACRSLDQARDLRTEFPKRTPTLRWACHPKSNLDGFYVGDRYYEKLTTFPSYKSDNW